MFTEFSTSFILNLGVWLVQLFAMVHNLVAGVLHLFFSEWAQINIAGFSNEQLGDVAVSSMQKIGVN